MSRIPKTVYVVSHTHWDREWYMTYHQFRVGLTRILDRVMAALETDGSFKHFLMDGQSIILEDYLEVRPDEKERIAALVRGGKLSIGPWYVLPDEFLVSAESTVRNLIVGHKAADGVGPVQKIGYLPDSFGHIAQLPQILRLAGIGSFVFTRGMGDEIEDLGHEFVWEAPDGSEVLAINQCEGYCSGGGLGFDEIWHAHTRREVKPEHAVEQVGELLKKMERYSNGDIYLLNNGCDHFPPQRDLGSILTALRGAFPQTEFKHASLSEYLDAVRLAGFANKRHSGEFISSRLNQLFPGVWSTRMYLKQRNDHCQKLLSDYLEPTLAYAHFILGHPYPTGLLEYCWRLLLKNHAHDSICGCSTDDVHREMGARFDGASQTAEQLLRQTLEEMAPTFARRAEDDRHTVICVMNPLPETRTEIVERLVVLQPSGTEVEKLHLLDDGGRPVDFDVVDVKYVERFWGVDYRTELLPERQRDLFERYLETFGDRILKTKGEKDTNDTFIKIQFVAENLPPLGHAVYHLTDRVDSMEISHGPVTLSAARATLENEYYRIWVHSNGMFDVEDKNTSFRVKGLNRLESTEDIGDTYDFSPAPESETITSQGVRGEVKVVEDTFFSVALEVRFHLPLPPGIDRDRRRRIGKRVPCEARTRIRLRHADPVIAVETVFDNRVEDHRLRVAFPTGVKAKTLISDGHFVINHRPIGRPDGEGWAQPPATTLPQQDFSLVQNDQAGLAVLNKGLPEIEASLDDQGYAELRLTLLRAVGWLSRDDFETRDFSNAGPTLPTPDAQCAGVHRFEYAVVPFAGDYLNADIKSISRRYRVPVISVQGVKDLHTWGDLGLIEKKTKRTSISAIKKHEARDTLVIRLYNLTGDDVEESLTFGVAIQSAWKTDLLEERIAELSVMDRFELPLPLGPHEIVTLEVELETNPIDH
ncbi:MAG: hypothetical protein JSW58_16685 [Candidatus Latescibacterota bacterium]|nr:MAG: hypothetical protein JSW58_16685 [Candidatus Latescibacterota bacterium]